jgi:Smr domain.
MKNEYIAIIHGNGEVLKSNLLKYLKKSKDVKEFNIDIYNSGQTLIKLDI